MVGWHHGHNEHGFGWIPGVGDGQWDLACCRKEVSQRGGYDWVTELNWRPTLMTPSFLVICAFSFSLVSLTKCLSILFLFSKNEILVLLTFPITLFSASLTFALICIIFWLALGSNCTSFSSFLRWKLGYWFKIFLFFLSYALNTLIFF